MLLFTDSASFLDAAFALPVLPHRIKYFFRSATPHVKRDMYIIGSWRIGVANISAVDNIPHLRRAQQPFPPLRAMRQCGKDCCKYEHKSKTLHTEFLFMDSYMEVIIVSEAGFDPRNPEIVEIDYLDDARFKK
jgi:hypothetical protein